MSKDHSTLFLEILNHIKSDTLKFISFVLRRPILIFVIVAVLLISIGLPLLYSALINYRYSLSSDDAVSICDVEFRRATEIVNPMVSDVRTRTTGSEVFQFSDMLFPGFYHVYLTYSVIESVRQSVINSNDVPPVGVDNTSSVVSVYCKVSSLSLQSRDKRSRVNLDRIVIYDQY